MSLLSCIVFALIVGGGSCCSVDMERDDISLNDISLIHGAARGIVTLPLHKAKLITTDEPNMITVETIVYFVVMDSSSGAFKDEFGGAKTSRLKKVHDSALELNVEFITNPSDGIHFIFHEHPGFISHQNEDGEYIRTTSNDNYSPIKKFNYDGNMIYANLPLIQWGDNENEHLFIDSGGCSPLIRGINPSPFNPFLEGPPGCTDDEVPANRYKSGQLLSIDTNNLQIEMKLHFSFYSDHKFPHYIVFETTKLPASEFMGVILSTKLTNLQVNEDSSALIYQFANGVKIDEGGPNRFQPGITEYADANGGSYTPLWEINWFFWDCNENGEFFSRFNRGNCDVCSPILIDQCELDAVCPSSEFESDGYSSDNELTFDPFQMDDKGVNCFNMAEQYATNGIIYSIDEADDIVEDGHGILTKGPPGLGLDSDLQSDLFVNCPVILTLDGEDCLDNSGWLSGENSISIPNNNVYDRHKSKSTNIVYKISFSQNFVRVMIIIFVVMMMLLCCHFMNRSNTLLSQIKK